MVNIQMQDDEQQSTGFMFLCDYTFDSIQTGVIG